MPTPPRNGATLSPPHPPPTQMEATPTPTPHPTPPPQTGAGSGEPKRALGNDHAPGRQGGGKRR